MEEGNMKRIHKIITLVFVPFLLIGCGTEQTTAPDPEPLVINTVEDGDDMLLTVIRDDGETVFQYEGNVELWKGADGGAEMTVRDLIDRLMDGIQSGELRGSDPVPADILEEDNKSVFEYLAEKYGIGEDDTDGR